MKRRMSLLLIGLLLVVQILQGFGFAGVASADEPAVATEQTQTAAGEQPVSDQTGSRTDAAGSGTPITTNTDAASNDGGQEVKDPAAGTETGIDGAQAGSESDPSVSKEEQPSELADKQEQKDASAAAARGPIEMTDNLLTSVGLTVLDSAGNTVTDAVYEQGANVRLDYHWALQNAHDYQGGDTFTFDLLPADKFVLFNDVTGDLTVNESDSVGTFKVNRETRKVTMTFNEFIKNYDNVLGTITLNTQFDKKKITGSTHQRIEFPIRDMQPVDLVFRANVATPIDKSFVKPGNLNAKSIDWMIDVNKKEEKVSQAIVTDPLPAGLELKADSVEVYPLTVNLDGNVSLAQDAAPLPKSDYELTKTEGKDFALKFKGDIDSAYRIKFTTNVGADAKFENNKAEFENTATFEGDGITPVSASASAEIQSGALLNKESTGYSSADQSIAWAIKYNYGESSIKQTDAKLTDLFDASHKLKNSVDDIKVYPVTFENGNPKKGIDPINSSAYTV